MLSWCQTTEYISHARLLAEACSGLGSAFQEASGRLRDLESLKRYLLRIPGSLKAGGAISLEEVTTMSIAGVLARAQIAFRALQSDHAENEAESSMREESPDADAGEEDTDASALNGLTRFGGDEELLMEAAMALSEVLDAFRHCTTSDMLTGHRATIAVEEWSIAPTLEDKAS